MKLSIVMLNFNRPDYIKNNIIPRIKNNCDEIIVSHGKKETAFNHPNIKSLKHYGRMNKEYGLSLRFLSCLEAKNEFVLIMDDDIIPSKDTITFLYKKIEEDPLRIHGLYGRNTINNYSVDNCFGEVPVVLTRCLITTKNMCNYYMNHFRNFESSLVKNSKPYWNGEDILFSLLSIKKNGKLNKAYNLSHTNKWTNYLNFSTSISLDDGHINYRKKVTEEFIKKLDLEKKIKNGTNISYKKNQIVYFIVNSDLIYIILISVIILLLFIYKKRFS